MSVGAASLGLVVSTATIPGIRAFGSEPQRTGPSTDSPIERRRSAALGAPGVEAIA